MRRLGAHRVWLAWKGAESFAFSLGWTVAPILFVRELELGPLELVLAGTALEVAYFLFEVPTGILADTYGRRLSVLVGVAGIGAGFVATGLAPNVVVVLAAAAATGFAWTFKSGAEDAWLADEVGIERVARSYQLGAQAARLGALLGIGTAVALALVDLRLPVVAGGLAMLALAAGLAAVMPETGFRPRADDGAGAVRALARTGVEGARLLRGRPLLLLLVGIAFFAGAWSEGLDRLWEAHFLLDVGVPSLAGLDAVVWFGVLAAGTLVLALAVAQPLVRRLAWLGPRGMARLLLGLDALTIAGTLAFALAGSFALAVAAYWATRVVRSIGAPVFATWLNTSVEDSSIRATVISMTNLGDSAGEWGGGPALGAIGSAFGIRAALAAGAAALMPALPLYGRALRRRGREPGLVEAASAAG